MASHSLRYKLIWRGIIAHYVGLAVASIYVLQKIGGTSWLLGTPEAVFMGAVVASPWSTAMLLLFVFATNWLEKHVVMLCLVGPVFVWITAYLLILTTGLVPESWLDGVFISSIVASPVYYVLQRASRHKIEA